MTPLPSEPIYTGRITAWQSPLSIGFVKMLKALEYTAAVAVYLAFCGWFAFTITGQWFADAGRWHFVIDFAEILRGPAAAIDYPWQFVLASWGIAITLWVPMHLTRFRAVAAVAAGIAGSLIGPLPILAPAIIVGAVLERLVSRRLRHQSLAIFAGILPGVAVLLALAYAASTDTLGGLSHSDTKFLLLASAAAPLPIVAIFIFLHTVMARREGTVLALLTVLVPAALLHAAVFENAIGREAVAFALASPGIAEFDEGPAPAFITAETDDSIGNGRRVYISPAHWPNGLIDGGADVPILDAARRLRAQEIAERFALRRSAAVESLLDFARDYPHSALASAALLESARLQCRALDGTALGEIGHARIVCRLPVPGAPEYGAWRHILTEIVDTYPASGPRCLADAMLAEDLFRQGRFDEAARRLPALLDNCHKYLAPEGPPSTERGLAYLKERWTGNLSYYDVLSLTAADDARRRLLALQDQIASALKHPDAWREWFTVVLPYNDERARAEMERLIDEHPKAAADMGLPVILAAYPSLGQFRRDTATMILGLRASFGRAGRPDTPTVIDGPALDGIRSILDTLGQPAAGFLVRLARRDARLSGGLGAWYVELGHPLLPAENEAALEIIAQTLYTDKRIALLLPLTDAETYSAAVVAEAVYRLGRVYAERFDLTGEARSMERAQAHFNRHLDILPDSAHFYAIAGIRNRFAQHRQDSRKTTGSTP